MTNMKNHSKNVPNRNFVIELADFGLKRSNNYKNRCRQLSSKLVFTPANMKIRCNV